MSVAVSIIMSGWEIVALWNKNKTRQKDRRRYIEAEIFSSRGLGFLLCAGCVQSRTRR